MPIIYLPTIPRMTQFLGGTPRDRILAALRVTGETDQQTIAFRAGLEMEVVYRELATMMNRGMLLLGLQRREYTTYRLKKELR